MTGQDLAMILNGQIAFFDAFSEKVTAMVKSGRILLPIGEI
jgi:hypothetical protein